MTRPRASTGSKQTALTVVVLMLPPTVNHMYRPDGRGGKILTDQAQDFRRLAGYEARITANLTRWRVPDGSLKLTLLLTFGDRRKTDIDNRIKPALDALALALDFDDSRVDRIEVVRVGVDPRRPLCEMILEGLA